MRRYYLQSGLWMGVFTLLILGGLYVAADLNATDRPSNALNIDGEFWSDTGTGFALDKISGRSTKIALGPNANATVSIDLIGDSGAGNQIDDGVTSGTASGQGTKIAVEVFAKGVTTPLAGVRIEFDFDASVLTFDKAENSAFQFIIPEATGAGANLAATAPVALPQSGFIGRVEFSTVVDVTGRAFRLGIKQVTLAESAASIDIITTTDVIRFNAAPSPSSPDFDGDGTVGIPDFLEFVNHFGTSRGDAGYDAKYDLDSNGAIGIPDFLIFVDSFGKPAPLAIPDANLRAAIETALGKASGAPITRAEMVRLTQLEAPNSNISDLTGLEFATNLTRLKLNSNSISDLTPLSSLTNLRYLSLWNNSISDINITPLSSLTNLTELWLHSNSLSDITLISNLTNLTSLSLSNDNISDITLLSNLTNLTRLVLYSNSLSDIRPLSNLTNLTRLELYSYSDSISDLRPLSNLTNLTVLELDSNSISDLTPLSNLTNLYWLRLDSNSISDLTLLSNLTNLTGLGLNNINISDSDLTLISNLTNLTSLSLNNINISDSDLTLLSNLTNLTVLWLRSSSISDLTPLSNLTNLEWLVLSGNLISDLTPLSNLTNLTVLWLNHNNISDISPLVANTGLGSGDWVDMRYNPLSATSINTHIPALQDRGVEVIF